MTISIEETPARIALTSEEFEDCYRLRKEREDRLEVLLAALPAPESVRRTTRRRAGKKTVVRVVLNREENAALMRRGTLPSNLDTKKLTRRQANMVSIIRAKQAAAKDIRQATVNPRSKAPANGGAPLRKVTKKLVAV